MLSFRVWLETSLKTIIQPVPQSAKWHGEGNVWIHTRMVRKQLNDAIIYLRQLVSEKNSAFENLDANLSPGDINLLRIGAWMHDIGKASATTVDDTGVHAHGHEDPEHFEPMMQQLGQPWQTMYQNASPEDKEVLWYIIQHHMALKSQGFGGSLLRQLVDRNGKFKNDRRVKLLLILILMDQSGRISLGRFLGKHEFPEISGRMQTSANRAKIRPHITSDDPATFISLLQAKGLSPELIRSAFHGKFGHYPHETASFREFLILQNPNFVV